MQSSTLYTLEFHLGITRSYPFSLLTQKLGDRIIKATKHNAADKPINRYLCNNVY